MPKIFKIVTLSILFMINMSFVHAANQELENNQLSLAYCLPATLLLNAFYLAESSLLLKYDRDFDRYIAGVEFGESYYFVTKNSMTRESAEMAISSKEFSLLIKYRFSSLSDSRISIGYGLAKGDGDFSSVGEREVKVDDINYQILQLGLETVQTFQESFFYSLNIKYKTLLYNDSRIPSYWNNKRIRFESIPSIGASIGWHF